MFRVLAPLMAMVLAAPALPAAVVAHAHMPEETISRERIRDMLLGRITTWRDGAAVVIVLADDPEADRRLRELAGRDRDRLVRGWKRLVFSGSGAMPIQVAGVRDALEVVARIPGAVAVLDTVSGGEGYRILPLVDDPPPLAPR